MKPGQMAKTNPIVQLEQKYCPPLDTATFLAIVSDYDLDNSAELAAACQVLDQLADGSRAEEGTGFDPSGTSGGNLISSDEDHGGRSGTRSEGSSRGLPSSATDVTTASQGMAALDLEGIEDWSRHTIDKAAGSTEDTDLGLTSSHLDELDDNAKETVLQETFPGLKPFDIQWALKKAKGNASLAIEELLNQVFLEESGERPRGVDGFSESNQSAKRKTKGKKKRPGLADVSITRSRDSSPSDAGSTSWENARREVEFISVRTNMPMQQVSSIYHKNNALLSATINAIIEAHAAVKLEHDDSSMEFEAQELNQQFPTIPVTKLLSLLQLTYPSKGAAQELAKALITSPPRSRTGTPVQIEFRHAPPDLVDSTAPAKLKPKSRNVAFSDDYVSSQSTVLPSDSREYVSLRNGAFNQASAAYRRGKSDHLMGGAAAYYASLGRDYDVKAKSAASAEADELVRSQSSDTVLDLHGVEVKDAVRIAREFVTSWWLRVERSSGGVGSHTGYKIVTGKGMHSEGGRGRLGPAVSAMLIREGWKVEVGSGALLVTGVAKRK